MDWFEQPVQPPPADRTVTGVRRGILTAILAVGLLGVGGVAAVMAASPDPSATPAPNATQPSDGGTTAPSTKPGRGTGHDCPNMGNRGSGTPATPSPGSGTPSGTPNGVSGSSA